MVAEFFTNGASRILNYLRFGNTKVVVISVRAKQNGYTKLLQLINLITTITHLLFCN